MEAEAPDAAVLSRQVGAVVLGHDGDHRVFRLGIDILVEEDVTDGVGIGIAMHQAGDGVSSNVGAVAALAESPAQLVATSLVDDAALALLPGATAVNIPLADVLKLLSGLVADRQVLHLAAAHIA